VIPYDGYGWCTREEAHQDYQVRQPPGVIVERLDCRESASHGELGTVYRYVILENGELWVWSKGFSIGYFIEVVIYASFSAVVGGLLGLFLWWLLRRVLSARTKLGVNTDTDTVSP
jgi:hypothetical protein